MVYVSQILNICLYFTYCFQQYEIRFLALSLDQVTEHLKVLIYCLSLQLIHLPSGMFGTKGDERK